MEINPFAYPTVTRLTSRERVRRALARQPIDRIPNGLGGTETTGLHLLAYQNLKELFGVQDLRCRMSTFMTTALVEVPVIEAIQGDIILLSSKLCPSQFWGKPADLEWKKQEFWGRTFQVPQDWQFEASPDGTIFWKDTRMKCPPGGIYFDDYPGGEWIDPCPHPDDYHPQRTFPDEYLRLLEETARFLFENTPYSISCGELITDLQHTPGGTENWWIRLIKDRPAAHEFLFKATEAALCQIQLLDQAIGKYADMMQIANDIGDAQGITIGPRLWREVYKPHYLELLKGWHERTHMKVNLHCCGSITEILDDLIECGVDVYNPVQISGNKMSPANIKERFGDRLIFYGGAYDAILTPPDTPETVVFETVKENIQTFSRGGGYIFAAVHNIPGDTPKSHLRAIFRAFEETKINPPACR